MSDYRDPNDPMYGNRGYEPADRTGTSWGWIAGAVFLVIVLALAFGVGHEPSRVASNNAAAPQATAPALPSEAQPSTVPGLTPPPSQAPNRP
jgi:hypothetical protein